MSTERQSKTRQRSIAKRLSILYNLELSERHPLLGISLLRKVDKTLLEDIIAQIARLGKVYVVGGRKVAFIRRATKKVVFGMKIGGEKAILIVRILTGGELQIEVKLRRKRKEGEQP